MFTQEIGVPVAGGELCVGLAGEPPDAGAPVVVCVHGITSNHLAFGRVVRHVGHGLTLVAPDLRGRGGSAGLPGPYGMRAHAADLESVLDHLGLDTVVAVGHSMGAFVVAMLAVVAPERTASVVLVDGGLPIPAPVDVDPDAVIDTLLGPAVARLNQTFASADDYVAFWRAHPAFAYSGVWNDDVEAWVRSDLDGSPPALRPKVAERAVRTDGAELIVDDEARMAAALVTAPTHLLRAEWGLFHEPNPLIPAEDAAAFAGTHPNVVVEAVPGANHYTILLGDDGARAVGAAISAALATPG